MRTKLGLWCSAAILCMIQVSVAQTCNGRMTLLQLVNTAADLQRGAGSESAQAQLAINRCYTLNNNLQSDQFRNAPPDVQERFLFEYLNAVEVLATSPTPVTTKAFREQKYRELLNIASEYLDWFDRQNQDVQQRSFSRYTVPTVTKVVLKIGNAYTALNQYQELIDQYESIAGQPRFFRPNAVGLWERSVRSLPDFKRRRSLNEIHRIAQENLAVKLTWGKYCSFLPEWLRVFDMKEAAQKDVMNPCTAI
jgi:hypothetical protein